MLASIWMEAIRDVFAGLGGLAALTLILVFLSKALLKHSFHKDLADHHAQLANQVIQAYNDVKLQSDKQLEMLKTELFREVEQFKYRLEIAAHERRTVFEAMHRERAAAIEDVYTKLVKAFNSLYALRNLGGADIPAARAAQAEITAFYQAFDYKRIYFTEEITPRVLEIEHLMGRLVEVYLAGMAPGHADGQLDEMQRLRNMVAEVRRPLEVEFRRLLGVVQEYPVRPQGNGQAQAPGPVAQASGRG